MEEVKYIGISVGIIVIFYLAVVFFFDDSNGDYSIHKTSYDAELTTYEIDKLKPEVIKADTSKEFSTLAHFNKIDREEVVFTFFVREYEYQDFNFQPNNLFCYIEDPKSKKIYFSDVFIEDFNSSDFNLAISCVLDKSGSVYSANFNYQDSNNLSRSYNAYEFIEAGLDGVFDNLSFDDKASIIAFGTDIQLEVPFTRDKEKLKNYFKNDIENMGGTSLYDGLEASISSFQSIDPSEYVRSIILFADGDDNDSRSNVEEIIEKAIFSGIPIFSVGLISGSYNGQNLIYLSERTGGFLYLTSNIRELDSLYSKVNKTMRSSFIVTAKFGSVPDNLVSGNFIVRVRNENGTVTELKTNNIKF